MKPKGKEKAAEEMTKVTMRLSQPLWAAVQHRAIDDRTTATAIVEKALQNYLKGGRQ